MYRQIVIAAGVLLLTACGSGSDEVPTLDVNFDSEKGRTESSSLGESNVVDLDVVTMNSRSMGTISEGESLNVHFTPDTTELVMIRLTSATEDLDLLVWSDNYHGHSLGETSSEFILLEAIAGETYHIVVWSVEGSGELALEVAEPSRSGFGLTNNEYLYFVNMNVTAHCDVDGIDPYPSSEGRRYIINYQEGYIKYQNIDQAFDFDKVQDVTVTVSDSFPESGDKFTESMDIDMVFTVNPDTGDISGTDVAVISDVSDGERFTCTFENEFSGSIIL